MSPFISHLDLQYLPPPYLAVKSRIASFLIPAANGSVQRLLDATLNAAATPDGQATVQRFKPLLGIDQFLLTFVKYPSLRSPGSPWGSFSYQEWTVFLPIVDEYAGFPGLCWHLPFLVLDGCVATILGREIYGIPKIPGRLNFGPLLADGWMGSPAGTLTVDVEGFAKPGAAEQASYHRIAQVDILRSPLAPFDRLFENLDPLGLLNYANDLARPGFIELPLFDFLRKLISTGIPGIMLKEFPGGNSSAPPAYRCLLNAEFVPSAISGLRYIHANVKLGDPASFPLASTFGITPGTSISSHGILMEATWEIAAPVEM